MYRLAIQRCWIYIIATAQWLETMVSPGPVIIYISMLLTINCILSLLSHGPPRRLSSWSKTLPCRHLWTTKAKGDPDTVQVSSWVVPQRPRSSSKNFRSSNPRMLYKASRCPVPKHEMWNTAAAQQSSLCPWATYQNLKLSNWTNAHAMSCIGPPLTSIGTASGRLVGRSSSMISLWCSRISGHLMIFQKLLLR